MPDEAILRLPALTVGDQFWTKQASLASKPNWKEISSYSGQSSVSTADRVRAYLACVSFIDDQIGRFMSGFRNMPPAVQNNSLLILWSDHGFHFDFYGVWGKWTLYESSTRIPLAIVPPISSTLKVAKGSKVKAPVESIDIVPTVLDLCGITSSIKFSGTSLVPLMTNPSGYVKAAAISQMPSFDKGTRSMGYSIRTMNYRMIVYTTQFDQNERESVQYDSSKTRNKYTELYNLSSAGLEQVNVYGQPAYEHIADEIFKLFSCREDLHWSCLLESSPFDFVTNSVPPSTGSPATNSPTALPSPPSLAAAPTTAAPLTGHPSLADASQAPTGATARPSVVQLVEPTKAPSMIRSETPSRRPSVSPILRMDEGSFVPTSAPRGSDIGQQLEKHFQFDMDEDLHDLHIPESFRRIGILRGTWYKERSSLAFTGNQTCAASEHVQVKDLMAAVVGDETFVVSCIDSALNVRFPDLAIAGKSKVNTGGNDAVIAAIVILTLLAVALLLVGIAIFRKRHHTNFTKGRGRSIFARKKKTSAAPESGTPANS